jgi:hypothetical protein
LSVIVSLIILLSMKNQFIKLCTLVLFSVSFFSCEKDFGDNLGPVQDSVANIPVTVTNATYFERYPVVTTSVAAGGKFTINFEIPADKGRIKEITRVVTGPAAIANFTNLNLTTAASALNATGTGASRVVTPIAGNGSNQISFSSDVATYFTYRVANGANFGPIGGTATAPAAPAPSATATPTEIQYYFRFTLEDGTTIVPMPVRVRVIQ